MSRPTSEVPVERGARGTRSRRNVLASSPFIASVLEFFTLAQTSKVVAKIADGDRRRVDEALQLGRQKASCAETLWSNGHVAEGLALAASAFDATLQAAPELAETPVEAEASAPASPSVLPPSELDRVRRAVERSRAPLPRLDRDVSPAHAELFQELSRVRALVDMRLAPTAMTSRDVKWTRAQRVAALVVTGVAVVGGLAYALRTPSGTFATASDFFQQSPQFAPEMVIDGNRDTYWLLPDGATGWVEIEVSPARHVQRVRLLNTTNPPYADRGTNGYRIEAYSHGELLRSVDGQFAWTDSPDWVSQDLDLDDVDRIRVVVLSHHRVGAGLAEVAVE